MIPTAYVESLSVNPNLVEEDDTNKGTPTGNIIDWKRAQDQDKTLRFWRESVEKKQKPTNETKDCNILKRQFNKLVIRDGILYRDVNFNEKLQHQLVLPQSLVSTVLEALHNDMGHPGKDRTLSLVRERFYWAGMIKDVENHINTCGRCLRRKTPTNQRAPLVSITTNSPLELVCMDYLTLEPSKGGIQNILVITDHFTRFALAIPTKNQTARTTAEALFNNFIIHYGIPDRIHSDQGANFESKLIKELCNITGMAKSRTTSYHPMGNGLTERYNRTLLGMLGTLEPHQKKNWKAYVGPLVHAYNCTRHESTGYSPYFLMFGREPRLPIDVTFGLRKDEIQPQSNYIKDLRNRLEQAYEIATKTSQEAKRKQKEGYDIRTRGGTIKKGDRVLVRIVAFDGKHKLADKWEEEPYIVLDQRNPDMPVYTVQKESGEGRKRVLHRNLLLPVGYITDTQKPIPLPRKLKPHPIPKERKKVQEKKQQEETRNSDLDESFEEFEVEISEDVDRNITISDDSTIQDDNSDVEEQNQDDDNDDENDEDDDNSESGGDAHSQSTEVSMDETEPEESESENTKSSVDEPPVPTRRSGREKKPPAWITSGEFQITKGAVGNSKDWMERAEYVTSLSQTELFKGMQQEAANTNLSGLK